MAGLSDLFTALSNIAANLGKLVAQTSLAIVVPITQGGTGATTAAGARTNLGIGSMGTQNASAVAVTGGTIDGTVIGGVTPAAGTFSALASASVTLTGGTISGMTSITGTAVSAGQSGTAGALDVFPATAIKGKTEFTAADNSGNTTTTIRTAAQAGARTYTIPDEGGNASFLLTGATLGSTGLVASPMPLLSFKNSDGTTLAAAASAGKFGITVTLGTAEYLAGESATSNTKTDVAITEVVLPPWYVAGQNITVTASCNYTLGGGGSTIGTHTLAAAAYLTGNNGSQGSTLIATSAQTVPASAGDVTFTITGATLSPSSRLVLSLTLVIQETGGGTAVGQVNSVRLS